MATDLLCVVCCAICVFLSFQAAPVLAGTSRRDLLQQVTVATTQNNKEKCSRSTSETETPHSSGQEAEPVLVDW